MCGQVEHVIALQRIATGEHQQWIIHRMDLIDQATSLVERELA